jgi:DNA-binding MarR family transcriptional regulator
MHHLDILHDYPERSLEFEMMTVRQPTTTSHINLNKRRSITFDELSTKAKIRKLAISRVLDFLGGEGRTVRSRPNDRDKRRATVSLTPRGLKFVASVCGIRSSLLTIRIIPPQSAARRTRSTLTMKSGR